MTQTNNMKVSAIVLAAGRSRRMGQTKQLLPLGTTTLLHQTLENLSNTTAAEIILVLGAAAESIQASLPQALLARLKVALNPHYAEGMATSLQAGLAAIHEESRAALIALADQPFIQPATYDRLMDEYRRTQARIIFPTYHGARGNPLVLARELFEQARTLEGDTGFRSLLGNHLGKILKVEVEDPGVLEDIDTEADYHRLRK